MPVGLVLLPAAVATHDQLSREGSDGPTARHQLIQEHDTEIDPRAQPLDLGHVAEIVVSNLVGQHAEKLFVVGPLALTARSALAPGWLKWLAYFACLGAAFMLIEVALLQRFVLLLGHPVYSLTVTLFSLLLGTSIGAAWSRRPVPVR